MKFFSGGNGHIDYLLFAAASVGGGSYVLGHIEFVDHAFKLAAQAGQALGGMAALGAFGLALIRWLNKRD